MILENGNIIVPGMVFCELPVPHKPYRPWFAYRNACGAPDAEALIQDFCHLLTIFLHYPENPWAFWACPYTLPASGTFFFVNKNLDHNCNIQRSYINALTK